MAAIKVVQVVVAKSPVPYANDTTLVLDDKGRVWQREGTYGGFMPVVLPDEPPEQV